MSREVLIRRLQPYLLLALFALPAIWPFIHPGLPRSNDHLIHLYRVVELDRLVRAGVLFPRWAPDLVNGYGYPVFNFVFSLAHGLVEVFHLLGLNLLAAYKATLTLILLCSAWFAYRLGREYFGEGAGRVAGLAYLYSPYLLYDLHIRGSLTESLMLALLPLAMLYLRRAARGHRPSVAWAGAALAVCVLAHHATMFQTMPFLGLYALWEAMATRQKPSPGRRDLIRNLSFAILPLALAALLSAFFWLPALVESRYVQVARGTLNAAMLYSNNFTSLSQLTAFPRLPVDPDLLNPPVVRPLPLAALALAILGLFRWRTLPHAPTRAFLILATLGAIAFMLPLARPLWDVLPLLRLTQFPWRILGPVSLFVALLAGATHSGFRNADFGESIPPSTIHPPQLGIVLTMGALVISGLPFASPPFEAVPAAPTLADVARFEIPPTFIGTTTTGEYLPIWVKQLPADIGAVRDRLARGEQVERFELPPSAQAQLTQTQSNALGDTLTLTTLTPFTVTYKTFYFPGWRATLDGQPVPVRITYPEGLMAVDLPAGTHTLTFQFGSTPPRTLGAFLSLLGLLATLWIIGLQGVRRKGEDTDLPPRSGRKPAGARRPSIFILALLLALARPFLYDAGYTPLLRHGLQPDGLLGIAHPLNQDFVGELTLLGWDAKRESGGADDSFTVNLYWKANHRLGVAYGFDVRLVDADGLTWSEPDPPHPSDWRFTPGTDFWPEDQYILDSYVLTPLAGTPPGEYFIEVNVFAYYNLQSIGTAQVGMITINAPSRRACSTEPVAEYSQFTLQSVELSTSKAVVGDEVRIALCWRASKDSPSQDAEHQFPHSTELEVWRAAGRPFTQGGQYPALKWHTGDVVRDQVVIRIPASIPIDDYHYRVILRVDATELDIGTLHITTPLRTFTVSPVAQTLNANLGPVTLFGVSASPESAAPGTVVTVTILWEGNREMATSYHVFAHLLGPDGTLVTQSDGVPADWTRRTTGWLPGEFVTDTRTLTLPADASPGDYTLWAGMYDPATGERLTTGEFPDGRVRLGMVRVGP